MGAPATGEPAMTCPVIGSRTEARDVSGYVSGYAWPLSGMSVERVRLYVRSDNRTTGGHVGSPCPVFPPGKRAEKRCRPVTARLARAIPAALSHDVADQSLGIGVQSDRRPHAAIIASLQVLS